MNRLVAWARDGWRGQIDPAVVSLAPRLLARAGDESEARRSRHARTAALGAEGGQVFVKFYPSPGAWRAWRAFRMGDALHARGFAVPGVLLIASRGGAGVLATRDVGGDPLTVALAALPRGRKRSLLVRLGQVVAALHDAGFVHGDMVPPNIHVREDQIVLLDHDRTRRGYLLVWWGGRRNLVQLGRFVVPGLTATDRARVLVAYGAARGLNRRGRHRLAGWVIGKTLERRAAIDRFAPADMHSAGFREVMRSGGRFDPADGGGGAP